MESLDDIILEFDDKMSKSFSFLITEFSGVRTGKASPALVENIDVPYYGTPTRLKALANISTPEPRLIVIHAFDPTVLPEIEKAILAANIGVTPMNDGRIIRIPIPTLNQERRQELTKVAKRMAEEGRVAIRNERRDANERVKKLQKSGGITEDELDNAIKDIQKSTDDYIAKIDELVKTKEKEIMTV